MPATAAKPMQVSGNPRFSRKIGPKPLHRRRGNFAALAIDAPCAPQRSPRKEVFVGTPAGSSQRAPPSFVLTAMHSDELFLEEDEDEEEEEEEEEKLPLVGSPSEAPEVEKRLEPTYFRSVSTSAGDDIGVLSFREPATSAFMPTLSNAGREQEGTASPESAFTTSSLCLHMLFKAFPEEAQFAHSAKKWGGESFD
eukprot:CAMPEP_0206548656 /NCGR_PEP_ID=MMETSP0325_2-20121206/14007_1 /ASSEMBLY_ACC=CAM_ASM_000347 /TAXON_ID=2866 /ORGANISM="Crypthecodinium cohnii, Strain Seligo" /LENGTH=195 /DNA_ID=CAMNT_0054048165 /DNA_START=260 /DNA_END=845 /DNA_ORIENTATION=-